MSIKCNEGESQADYKARRAAQNAADKKRSHSGWWFHKNERAGTDIGGRKVPVQGYIRAREEQRRLIDIGLYAMAMAVFPCILPPVPEAALVIEEAVHV